MPIDRDRLPSMLYWREDEWRRAQRFYVGFCLLMSSIQDTLLGLMERERHNLNWSATCSYYGLVHAGRLLSFLALGDFPTKHLMLRELLACKPGRNRKLLDWLSGFSDSPAVCGQLERSELGNLIISYFEQRQVQDFTCGFSRFVDVLNLAAPLRSDSNYEALLIAHEYRHDFMTEAFTELANAMSRAAESCLPLVSDVFSAFVGSDPDLAPERDVYRAFLYDYLHERVVTAIGRKLAGLPHLLVRLSRIAEGIQPTRPMANYDEVERRMDMSTFGPKSRLMRDFRLNVGELERVVARSP